MQRIISIDFLRTIIIIYSIFLHLGSKMSLENIFAPFYFVQTNFFTVGAFFIMVSGIMLYNIYLPRYKKDPKITSIKLVKKGVGLFVIYFFYVNILRLINFQEIPFNLREHFFVHPFFAKIIFTFSIIFLLAPLFLFFLKKIKHPNFFLLAPVVFLLITHFIIKFIPLSDFVATAFFWGKGFAYPIFPMLAIYSLGVWMGANYTKFDKQPSLILLTYFSLLFMYVFGVYVCSIVEFRFFWEMASLFILIILVELTLGIIQKNQGKASGGAHKLFIVGRRSLITYVGANFLIALLPNLSDKSVSFQLFIAAVIILATFILAWVYEYILKKRQTPL